MVIVDLNGDGADELVAAFPGYGLYKKAESMEDAVTYRRLTEKYDARRNRFLLAAAAVWGLNLLDISIIVKGKETGERALSLRIGHGGLGQVHLAASCRF